MMSGTEPIAVVGLGCRFPGANDPEAFWKLLRDGVDAISEVPPNRWDVNALYDPDPTAPGKMSTRWGGFLEGSDRFDCHFFGISPREVAAMDLQQRLLMEVAWEALENAAQTPEQLKDGRTGVFIGISSFDWTMLSNDLNLIEAYHGTGSALSIAANRLSYLFDLKGPSLSVDTACSSSLVAVHLACQSLWNRESDLVLAGGVNVILSPRVTITLSKAHMLAADGRCKTFDAAADGYVRGEGCGIVVLKRLSDALQDNDHIWALVRGTAVNQDGRSNGLTAPNGPAQQAAIRQALKNAGMTPDQIHYVEAHGTGTALGDPIEVQALAAVMKQGRSPDQPCVIGSVKPNIGHLEGAAGVSSFIKAVLTLFHEEIPPQIHFNKLNPYIRLEDTLVIPTERQPWPAGDGPRFAGVGSFGFGGTNCHVVLEEAPILKQDRSPTPFKVERPLHLLTLSAKGDRVLRRLARRFEDHLATHPSSPLPDICFTANTGRSHFDHRLAVTADSSEQLRERLNAFATGNGKQTTGLLSQQVRSQSRPKVVFLFTGQGSQEPGMGKKLYETQPTFRKALNRCAELLDPHLEQPLLSVLHSESGARSPLHQTVYAQPALFALEYALAEMWRSWGIEPSAVMGHSIGEYAAACVAGVLSLEDGLKLVAERARLIQALPQDGMMAVVFADEAQLAAALAPYQEHVSISAVNGPENTVISGVRKAVLAVIEQLKSEGVAAQPLTVSHAFHSPLMEPMLDAFERTVSQLQFEALRIPLISNLTGQMLEPGDVPDVDYWRRHLREPVRFAAGINTLSEQGYELFLELGPKPSLLSMGKRCLPKGKGTWLPSLRSGQDDWQVVLNSLGALYTHGVDVDWVGFDQDYERRRVPLPTYPFEREPLDSGRGRTATFQMSTRHPLLGQRLRSAHHIFESQLSTRSYAYLGDHRVQGAVVLPATAYVEMALGAAAEVLNEEPHVLSLTEIEFQKALFFTEDEWRTVQLILSPDDVTGELSFHIYSLTIGKEQEGAQESWTLHATGKIHLDPINTAPDVLGQDRLEEIVARASEQMTGTNYYLELQERGFQYGPHFQGIEQMWRREGESLGQLRIPEILESKLDLYRFHPAILDICLQVLAGAVPDELRYSDSIFLPIGVDRIRVYGRPVSQMWGHGQLRSYGQHTNVLEGSVHLFDEDGRVIVEVEGLRFQRLDDVDTDGKGKQRTAPQDLNDWLYEIQWHPLACPELEVQPTSSPGSWLIFANSGDRGEELAALLTARGERPVLVYPGEAYERLDESHVRIHPARPEEMHELLNEALGSEAPACRGVIHLWSLDALPVEQTTVASLETAQTLSCISVMHLIQALAETGWTLLPRLWLVTRGAQSVEGENGIKPVSIAQSIVWGLGRAIYHEHPELRCTAVDLDPDGTLEQIQSLFQEVWSDDRENQIALRGDVRYVARLVQAAKEPQASDQESESVSVSAQERLLVPQTGPFHLEPSATGILDELTLKPSTHRAPGPGEVEIEVRATGLNFRDVMKAMGIYPTGRDDILWLGDECAGEIVSVGAGVDDFQTGDEVIAVAPAAFGRFTTTPAAFVAPKPAHLSFEQATSIPIAFLTAYHALHQLGRLSKGGRVLIHAAAGGVGLAAVQIAQWLGAEIFATAGSPKKREFLRSLGVGHVMDSRSLDFAHEVMEQTDGQGVDVVLNSLAGEAMHKSLSILGPYGRFLEIGKRDIYLNSRLGLRPFQNSLSFFAIDMDRLFRERAEFAASLLREVMKKFEDGTFTPLPVTEFSILEVVDAFRYMARAKHIGKIVVSMPDRQASAASSPVGEAPATFRSDGSYLITGGLGGLGLLIAQWMARQGAGHLILTGRSGASEAAEEVLEAMRQAGAQVHVIKADVSQGEQVAHLLSEIDRSMPPLRGIVHAAGVLDNDILLNLNQERFMSVMAPKVAGAWNLHIQTQRLSQPLDCFVLFSSIASLFGSPGQGNYAAANAFLDALAHYRQSQGVPALSVNWGPWSEAGMAARGDREGRLALRGIGSITPEQGLALLERFLNQGKTQTGVVPVDWRQWFKFYPATRQSPMLSDLLSDVEIDRPKEKGSAIRDLLLSLELDERQKTLETYIQKEIARVLQLDPSRIDLETPLNTIGLDSLMAIELNNRVETELNVTLPMITLIQGPSISELATQLIELLEEPSSTPDATQTRKANALPLARDPSQKDAGQLLSQLDQLSDEEVDALLSGMLDEDEGDTA
ncbi:MAG: type I polyketide synthase [Candidatus Bipolaricaulia bacterium]